MSRQENIVNILKNENNEKKQDFLNELLKNKIKVSENDYKNIQESLTSSTGTNKLFFLNNPLNFQILVKLSENNTNLKNIIVNNLNSNITKISNLLPYINKQIFDNLEVKNISENDIKNVPVDLLKNIPQKIYDNIPEKMKQKISDIIADSDKNTNKDPLSHKIDVIDKTKTNTENTTGTDTNSVSTVISLPTPSLSLTNKNHDNKNNDNIKDIEKKENKSDKTEKKENKSDKSDKTEKTENKTVKSTEINSISDVISNYNNTDRLQITDTKKLIEKIRNHIAEIETPIKIEIKKINSDNLIEIEEKKTYVTVRCIINLILNKNIYNNEKNECTDFKKKYYRDNKLYYSEILSLNNKETSIKIYSNLCTIITSMFNECNAEKFETHDRNILITSLIEIINLTMKYSVEIMKKFKFYDHQFLISGQYLLYLQMMLYKKKIMDKPSVNELNDTYKDLINLVNELTNHYEKDMKDFSKKHTFSSEVANPNRKEIMDLINKINNIKKSMEKEKEKYDDKKNIFDIKFNELRKQVTPKYIDLITDLKRR